MAVAVKLIVLEITVPFAVVNGIVIAIASAVLPYAAVALIVAAAALVTVVPPTCHVLTASAAPNCAVSL